MFRWILHNWPDAFAVRILRALIPGLKPGAKVLIVDEIVSKVIGGSPTQAITRATETVAYICDF